MNIQENESSTTIYIFVGGGMFLFSLIIAFCFFWGGSFLEVAGFSEKKRPSPLGALWK